MSEKPYTRRIHLTAEQHSEAVDLLRELAAAHLQAAQITALSAIDPESGPQCEDLTVTALGYLQKARKVEDLILHLGDKFEGK